MNRMAEPVCSKPRERCCGCRACEQACARRCISMREDSEGFLYPVVDRGSCRRCGQCSSVCPMAGEDGRQAESAALPSAYAASHLDPAVLALSSSGGAFTAIVDGFCEGDYAVFGAAMNDDFTVGHRFIRDKAGLSVFRKSKYVQSDTGHCYAAVRSFLQHGVKVLFSGTPCQVAGLRSFLGEPYPTLFCIDVLCHGVPSPKAFRRYLDDMEDQRGEEISSIDFRSKSRTGNISWMSARFSGGKEIVNAAVDDDFGHAFLSNLCLRPSCHSCPFARASRVGDLSIGDFWGIEDVLPQFPSGHGASLVLVNTPLGKAVLDRAKQWLRVEAVGLTAAAKRNGALSQPAKPHPMRSAFFQGLDATPFRELVRVLAPKRSAMRRLASRVYHAARALR